MEEKTKGPLLRAKFYPDRCNVSPLRDEKPQNRPLSKPNTGGLRRMWANAQRDGRPAEYRWCPLFNTAKFGWRLILECRAVTLPRRETRWNLQGYPKLPDQSQPLVGWSSSCCGNLCRRYCCLTSFFPIVDTCLSCKDVARQSCALVPRWRFLTTFCVMHLQRAPCSTFQTCILNLH